MVGFPKHLNTKADVEYCLKEYPAEAKKHLQGLLDTKEGWITTAKLAEGKEGVTDATHRIAEITDDVTKAVIERYQEEYMVDPNGPIFKLGLTVKEVEDMVGR